MQEQSLWIYHLALSCCGLEVRAATGPRYDWERLGCHLVHDQRNADVLLISGPVTEKTAPQIKKIYDEMPSPKYVIASGSCASTGGMFSVEGPIKVAGVDAYIPVDLFVPGCPPRPESIIHAIIRLQDKMKEKRHDRS